MRRLLPLFGLTLFFACSDERDGARPDAGRSDAAASDAAASDAAAMDSGGLDSGGADAGSGDPTMCPSGSTLEYYSLTPLAMVPAKAALEFSGLHQATSVENAGTGQSHSGRFAICRDAQGTPAVRALLLIAEEVSGPAMWRIDETISAPVEESLQINGGFIFQIRLPPSRLAVSGLEAALSGDLDPLEIRFMHDTGLLVLGHNGFVALAKGNVGPTTIDYTSLTVVAGGLAPGDVFANLRCPFSQMPLSKTFRMGTATFSVEACSYLGGGFTTGYDIQRLSITDTNSALTAEEQREHVFEGAAAVEAVMNYRWNHHNACDSFHLALPHADYAATTTPAAGCGLPVPNAPQRDFNEDPSSPVKYRIRYHGGAWVDGEMNGCTHYLFCP